MKSLLTSLGLLSLLCLAESSFSQEIAIREAGVAFPQMKKYYGEMQRRVLDLPEIPDYYLLKADFHIHTVFSDGSVWPVTRVEEAFLEGLDAIAITDHIEFNPLKEYIPIEDHNLPYEIAKPRAEELGIILIRGAEITRATPAGHFNAIFIEDANKLAQTVNPDNPSDQSNIKEALQEAVNQGGFVFFNHPWHKHPENKAIWHPIHEELFKQNLIHGVEVNNRDRYYPNIFQWCTDKELAMMSTTDAHSPLFRLEPDAHRSMNILLVKERTKEGVRDALDNQRTVVYTQNYLYGKQEYVAPIFDNAVERKVIHKTNQGFIVELKNNSGLPFHITINETHGLKVQQKDFILAPNGNAALIFKSDSPVAGESFSISANINNCHVEPEVPLAVVFHFNL
jgi:3',5'-nucleoside bisphosphate phosphatase